jgi:hypothetical protein
LRTRSISNPGLLADLRALRRDPPPPPGPQERRSQNNAAYAISEAAFVYAVERKPEYLDAARKWLLAAVDYEPWGYTYNKPNVDLAAGHLLYAIGWAYDLLYHDLSGPERARVRASLERHADLVYEHFAPGPKRSRFEFTQNHNFIPTAGLGVAALALLGESERAPKWAALARAHHHRAGQLLTPDGYYYESFEYWIFSAPWLVHFLDAWEHCTGESLWDRGQFRNWKHYVAHAVLPDGQNAFDFGDIWEGPLTRAKAGGEYGRLYPGGKLESNYNILYRVAERLRDAETQAVAERMRGFGHGNLEEYWTLVWYDPGLAPAPLSSIPLRRHFEDSGLVFYRTSWDADATAFAFKAGPPEGHRATALLAQVPEWRPSTGHAQPDVASFIVWAQGRYLVGDTGYAGQSETRHHNTITIGGAGQGAEGSHDVWDGMDRRALSGIRIREATLTGTTARIVADAAAAYGPKARLSRFTRTFSFEHPGRFRIRDEIETAEPRPVQWYLHADAPFERRGEAFQLTGGPPSLEVAVAKPADVSATPGPTMLTAPGRPGAIEAGPKEQRGYQLLLEAAAPGTKVELDVTLTVR